MHEEVVLFVVLLSFCLDDPCGHREGGDPRRPDQRINLPAGEETHEFAEENSHGRVQADGYEPQDQDNEGLHAQKLRRLHRCPDTESEEERYDIRDLVFGGAFQPLHHARFLHQVSQHDHSNEGSSKRRHQGSGDGNHHGKENFCGLGDRLFHDSHNDLSFLFSRQQAHDRGLDERYQGHVRVSGHGNRPKEVRRIL